MMTWKEFKYKNLALMLVGVVLAFFLAQFGPFKDFLLELRHYQYLGAFLGGILFVSTFTFGVGTVILVSLSQEFSPIVISFIAGAGAVVGDLLIFRFVKDRLMQEIEPLFHRFGGDTISQIFYSHFFAWTLPVLGAIIIASPLPDELGVTLLGIANIKTSKFIGISYILNTAGIFLILAGYQALRA